MWTKFQKIFTMALCDVYRRGVRWFWLCDHTGAPGHGCKVPRVARSLEKVWKLHLKDSTEDHLAKSTNPKSQNSKIWFDNIFKIFEISNRPKTSSIFIKTSKTIRKTIQIPWRYHDVAIFITAFQFLNIVSEFGGWIFDHGQNWSWYLQGFFVNVFQFFQGIFD